MSLINFLIYGPRPQQVPDYGVGVESAATTMSLNPEASSKLCEAQYFPKENAYLLGPFKIRYDSTRVQQNIALWTTKCRDLNTIIGTTSVILGVSAGAAVKYLAHRYISIAVAVTAFALLVLSWIRSNQAKKQLDVWTIDPIGAIVANRKAALKMGFSALMECKDGAIHPTSINISAVVTPPERQYLHRKAVESLLEGTFDRRKIIVCDLLSQKALDFISPLNDLVKAEFELYGNYFLEYRTQLMNYDIWLHQQITNKFEKLKETIEGERAAELKVVRNKQRSKNTQNCWTAIGVVNNYFDALISEIEKAEKERVESLLGTFDRGKFKEQLSKIPFPDDLILSHQATRLFADIVSMHTGRFSSRMYKPLQCPPELNSPQLSTFKEQCKIPDFKLDKAYIAFMEGAQ